MHPSTMQVAGGRVCALLQAAAGQRHAHRSPEQKGMYSTGQGQHREEIALQTRGEGSGSLCHGDGVHYGYGVCHGCGVHHGMGSTMVQNSPWVWGAPRELAPPWGYEVHLVNSIDQAIRNYMSSMTFLSLHPPTDCLSTHPPTDCTDGFTHSLNHSIRTSTSPWGTSHSVSQSISDRPVNIA